MNKPITYFPVRRSVADPVPNWTITYQGKSLAVDEDTLPPYLVRMLPVPYCQADPKDFIPFCELAIAHGYMK